MFQQWMKLAIDSTMLAIESQQVIALRMMKVTAGGKGSTQEVQRMFTEKMQAIGEATLTVATGGSPEKVMREVRSKVRANRRRLSGG